MRKMLWLLLLLPVLLCGCGQTPKTEQLTGLTFERGNGSVEGDRLYIAMTESQITTLRYMPADSAQVQLLEQLSITPEQWQSVIRALEQLTLERKKVSFLEKLFPRQDGGDYRKLTLTYGEQEIAYRWPSNGQLLESVLEQLVAEVTP